MEPLRFMTDCAILRSHANQVFAMLREAKLDPSQFRWEDRQSRYTGRGTVSTLVHTPTGHYMMFDQSESGHFLDFSPAADRPRDQEHPGTWQLALEYIRLWIAALRREVEAPDLWQAISGERALIGDVRSDRGAQSSFTMAEQERIAASLREIREYVAATQNLTKEQFEIVNTRLSYLEEASTRVGRKDWVILAVGALTNIVVAAAFSPDAARELFRFAGQVLGWAMGGSALLP